MATLYFDSGGASTNSGTSDNNAADLSGSADATVVANSTFLDAAVNTTTNQVTVTAHGYTTGTGVELTTSGTLPAGLTLTTLYYLNAIDANTITFHTNITDALAATNAVDITAAAGGGTHTINNYTINLGGTPDLSAVRGSHCRVTTTGTSHVITMNGCDHGMASGDPIFLRISSGGTLPGALTVAGAGFYVNALTTTTFRVYTTKALALAGGASDINVTSAGARTLEVMTLVQAAVALASASNTNRKHFWVRAVSDANNLLIVDAVVTGLGAGSNWAIGGRVSAAGAVDMFNNVRRGDTIIQNTDISANPLNILLRAISINVGPHLSLIGKPGARRLLTNAGNGTLFDATNFASGPVRFKNIELQSQGTGAIFGSGPATMAPQLHEDCRWTDSGATAWTSAGTGIDTILLRCEMSGLTGAFVMTHLARCFVVECYIHDNAGVGIAGPTFIFGSIFERNAGQAITPSGNSNIGISYHSTFYANGNSGIELNNAGTSPTTVVLVGNIFKDNGNAATEANIEFLQDATQLFIEYDNCVNISGALGGVNTLGNITLGATTITTDPLFVDPDAAIGSRNFGLQSGSPAKGIPFTFLNSLSVSYRDMGAVQHQEVGGGGGIIRHPGVNGGLNA